MAPRPRRPASESRTATALSTVWLMATGCRGNGVQVLDVQLGLRQKVFSTSGLHVEPVQTSFPEKLETFSKPTLNLNLQCVNSLKPFFLLQRQVQRDDFQCLLEGWREATDSTISRSIGDR